MLNTNTPALHEQNAAQFFAQADTSERNAITFLNMTGDITITWDDTNKDKILEMIRRKMSDGYVFFTLKRVPLIGVTRKVRVSNKNINDLESVVIPDKEFDKMVAGMDDRDLAATFAKGDAQLAKRQADSRKFEAGRRLEKAEDVLKEQSMAVRPISGG